MLSGCGFDSYMRAAGPAAADMLSEIRTRAQLRYDRVYE